MAVSRRSVLTSSLWAFLLLGGVALSLPAGWAAPSAQLGDSVSANNNTNVTTAAPDSKVTTPALDSNVTATEAPTNMTTAAATNMTTAATNATTEPPHNGTTISPNGTTSDATGTTEPASSTPAHTSPSTKPTTPHTPRSGGKRKFDVASFFGGAAAAVGITVIVYVLVRCYTNSKKTRYNAM